MANSHQVSSYIYSIIIAQISVSHAFSRLVLMNIKSFIKTILELIMTCFTAFNMKDSRR